MSRLLLPTGMIALCLGVLAWAAQDREQPPPDTPRPSKAASPDRDVIRGKTTAAPGEATRKRRSRVYLGVYTMPVEEMSSRARRKLKLNGTDGVIVLEVMPDSPAEEAGLRHGDVITHVNGQKVEDEEELSNDLNKLGPGKKVKLVVLREGKKQDVTAELEEGPANDHAGSVPEGEHGRIEEFEGHALHEAMMRIDMLERQIFRLERKIDRLEQRSRSGAGAEK